MNIKITNKERLLLRRMVIDELSECNQNSLTTLDKLQALYSLENKLNLTPV